MSRVLVVDDEPGLRQSLGLLLSEAGYEFTVGFGGPESPKLTVRYNGSDNGCYVNYAHAKARAGAALELAVPVAPLGVDTAEFAPVDPGRGHKRRFRRARRTCQ